MLRLFCVSNIQFLAEQIGFSTSLWTCGTGRLYVPPILQCLLERYAAEMLFIGMMFMLETWRILTCFAYCSIEF